MSARAARWATLWQAMNARGSAHAVLEELEAAWNSPGRVYHTLQHLDQVLTALDRLRNEADEPVAAELALWMHDVVWEPMAPDCEARSVRWMQERLGRSGLPSQLLSHTSDLIMSTRHLPVPPASRDEAVVRDADLAILAAPAEEFDRYDRAIREEYSAVPDEQYRAGRSTVLQGFRERSELYFTRGMRPMASAARRNLGRALDSLQIGL